MQKNSLGFTFLLACVACGPGSATDSTDSSSGDSTSTSGGDSQATTGGDDTSMAAASRAAISAS